MQIAQTILNQLGGNKFIAMTGAKQFVSGESHLTFKIPSRFAKDGINCIRITLNEKDLYDVEYMKIWGINVKEIAKESDIYADMLQSCFKETTGLDTSL